MLSTEKSPSKNGPFQRCLISSSAGGRAPCGAFKTCLESAPQVMPLLHLTLRFITPAADCLAVLPLILSMYLCTLWSAPAHKKLSSWTTSRTPQPSWQHPQGFARPLQNPIITCSDDYLFSEIFGASRVLYRLALNLAHRVWSPSDMSSSGIMTYVGLGLGVQKHALLTSRARQVEQFVSVAVHDRRSLTASRGDVAECSSKTSTGTRRLLTVGSPMPPLLSVSTHLSHFGAFPVTFKHSSYTHPFVSGSSYQGWFLTILPCCSKSGTVPFCHFAQSFVLHSVSVQLSPDARTHSCANAWVCVALVLVASSTVFVRNLVAPRSGPEAGHLRSH